MQVIRNPHNHQSPKPGSVVALGNFDGIHIGHQQIFTELRDLAYEYETHSAVLTFKPHPVAFFAPSQPAFRITPFRTKYELLQRYGIDICYLLAFNQALASMKAEEFIEHILIKTLAVRHIVIGHDFIFGHQRQGNAELLRSYADQGYFGMTQLSPVVIDGKVCSSTLIRHFIREGEMERASAMLGHDVTLCGRVRQGFKRGRELGYPTANMNLHNVIRPKFGVYAAYVDIEGDAKRYKAAVNIGVNPSFEEDVELLEAYILDFDQDIYGKHIKVALRHYIREEKQFSDLTSLTSAIGQDVSKVRGYLN